MSTPDNTDRAGTVRHRRPLARGLSRLSYLLGSSLAPPLDRPGAHRPTHRG